MEKKKEGIMTITETMEYLNGRTMATAQLVSFLLIYRNAPANEVIGLLEASLAKQKASCDGTPEGKAHVAGIETVLETVRQNVEAADAMSLLAHLPDDLQH